MKSILTSIIILLVSINVFCQKIEFDIHHNKLADYLLIEKKLGSTRFNDGTTHMSTKGIAQPIIFRLKQNLIPDLLTYYYFYEKDSTIHKILYEWDISNFDKKENNKQTEEFQKALIIKYNELEKEVNGKYGVGTVKGSLDIPNTKEGLDKRNDWKPNDSISISLYTYISNRYEKNGNITISPTARIRLYINNEASKVKPQKLSKELLDSLNKVTFSFIRALFDKDLIKSKSYLSDIIIKNVTDAQLLDLRELIHFERSFSVFMNGVEIGTDGNIYPMLQIKYEDDTLSPPKEMIKVIFDNKNKIILIQPLNRTTKVN